MPDTFTPNPMFSDPTGGSLGGVYGGMGMGGPPQMTGGDPNLTGGINALAAGLFPSPLRMMNAGLMGAQTRQAVDINAARGQLDTLGQAMVNTPTPQTAEAFTTALIRSGFNMDKYGPIMTSALSFPGSPLSVAQQGNIQVGSGTQTAPNTYLGQAAELQNAQRVAQINAGATMYGPSVSTVNVMDGAGNTMTITQAQLAAAPPGTYKVLPTTIPGAIAPRVATQANQPPAGGGQGGIGNETPTPDQTARPYQSPVNVDPKTTQAMHDYTSTLAQTLYHPPQATQRAYPTLTNAPHVVFTAAAQQEIDRRAGDLYTRAGPYYGDYQKATDAAVRSMQEEGKIPFADQVDQTTGQALPNSNNVDWTIADKLKGGPLVVGLPGERVQFTGDNQLHTQTPSRFYGSGVGGALTTPPQGQNPPPQGQNPPPQGQNPPPQPNQPPAQTSGGGGQRSVPAPLDANGRPQSVKGPDGTIYHPSMVHNKWVILLPPAAPAAATPGHSPGY